MDHGPTQNQQQQNSFEDKINYNKLNALLIAYYNLASSY